MWQTLDPSRSQSLMVSSSQTPQFSQLLSRSYHSDEHHESGATRANYVAYERTKEIRNLWGGSGVFDKSRRESWKLARETKR